MNIDDAPDMIFDRAHRIGLFNKKNKDPRPIVVKFHYYRDREIVRKRSYECKDLLKQNDLGVGIQWPKAVRETREQLYPLLNKLKKEGRDAKFVKDKLFVDGNEYVPPPVPKHK